MIEPNKDAYGQMIYAYYQHKPAIEIIEREDGFIDDSGGPPVYFAEYENWNPIEKEAMQAVPPGRVLDIGCGAGRMALYLQSQGHPVTGIDNSPLAVEVCRLRGVQDARLLSITQVNASLGTFDAILMMGNNWGLMGSYRRARWLLRKFHAITSPQARIIANSVNPYQTDDPCHLAYHESNRQRGRMGGQVRIRCRYRTCIGPWFDYLLVSKEEMAGILEGTGWKVARWIDSAGPVYIAVLEKD